MQHSQQRGRMSESDLLKIVLIQRALTYRDVAKLIGKSPQRVANVLSNTDRTWPIRAAINRALRLKIFSKPNNTRRRRRPAPATIEIKI